MRILFVGDDELRLETESLAQRHTVYPVTANVTHERLLSIAASWPADIIHFGCHASEAGIVLDSGLLTADQAARLARMAKAKAIVLNACSSSSIASELVNRGVPFVFFGTSKTTDSEAHAFAVSFYQSLNGDAKRPSAMLEAYQMVDEGDGRFGWTMNPQLAAKFMHAPGIPSWQWLIVAIVAALSVVLSVVALMA